MSDTQLAVLDHTLQLTHGWLNTLMSEHHFQDRHQAYSALRAVLHALRDRLTTEQAVHLGAQLPMLVRGIYYEGWHVSASREPIRHVDEFTNHVARELPPQFPRDALGVAEAVLDLLWRELDPGETAKIVSSMPIPLRQLWPTAAR